MTLSNINAEVEKRVREAIVPVLLDRLKTIHAKYEWRTCPCSYCKTKRHATEKIANAGRYRSWISGESYRDFQRRIMRMHLDMEYHRVVDGTGFGYVSYAQSE